MQGGLSRRAFARTALAAALLPRVAAAQTVPELLIPPADRELRVPVRGGSIFVRTNGNLNAAAKPLLLAHGGPGGACWQMFPAVPLAAQRGVILYDQLDSGHSDAPGDRANWTVERFASEIDAIRAALDLQAFHLLGHSWGGIVATRYAARQPAGLKSLILQGPPLSARMFAEGIRSRLDVLTPEQRALALRQQRGEPVPHDAQVAAAKAFSSHFMYREPKPRSGLAYMDGTPLDRGRALADYMTGLPGFRFTGQLAKLDDEHLLADVAVPTLLMCGQFDFVTPTETRKLLPKLHDGAFVEVAGAGHMIQFDRPDAWRREIAGFLSAHDR